MSPNQTTDQTTMSAKDKADAQKRAQLDATTAGTLDKQSLDIVKKTQTTTSGAGLHHVELTDSGKQTKPAETITIQKGETLSEIAKKELGKGASTRDIYNFVEKIAEANEHNKSMTSKDLIAAGGSLLIPEHITDVPKPTTQTAGGRRAERSVAPGSKPADGSAPKPGADVPPKSPSSQPRPGGEVPTPAPGTPQVKPGDASPQTPSTKPAGDAQPQSPSTKPAGDAQPQQPAAKPTDSSKPTPQPADQTSAAASMTDAQKTAAAANNPGDVFNAAKQKELEDDAKAVRKATGNDNVIARWADKDGINKILEGKTDAERAAINFYYKKDFKTDLDTEVGKFEKGSDLDKFKNILHRQDGDANKENASRIHEDLLERNNLIHGRSNSEIEKDIRDTLSSHNSDQIAKMNADYKAAYGVSLNDAIANDPKVSQSTKDMADVYLKKTAQSGDADTKKLIDIALKSKKEECFAEAMKDASPAARKDFLDNGGEKRVQDTFSHWYSNADVTHAMDYAKEGKLDAATQIADNTHLINNDKGIELAIKSMSDDDRKMYQEGKTLSTGGKVDGLSADDTQKAKDYYSKLHDAIEASGNATQAAQREDEINTANGSGSLISNLASHRGTLWNDGEGKIDSDIRGMSQADWNDCKNNPERREQLKAMLGTMDKSAADINSTLAVYDKMLGASSYATAKDQGQESVLTKLDDSKHWYGTNRNDVIDSISNMSKSEQEQYRTDANFRKQVDDKVAGKIEDLDGQDAVKRMLDCVKNGKPVDSDVIANLEKIQNLDGSKTTDAANAIDKAFHDDPTLKDRILHPQTDDDKKLAQQFKTAVQNSFGDDYDTFGKPYVDTGALPLDLKLSMSKGVFSDDNQQITNDLKSATPEEKAKLINDPKYREQVLGFMSADRQQIAMAVVTQGEERPEDKVRAATVGWGGSSDIISDLQGLSPADLEKAKVAYADKYGSSLEGDLTKKLGGKEREEAERIFTQNLSSESRVNIAKDQTENTRSGFGAAVSDNVWRSGTGAQADNAVDQTVQALTEKNKEDQAIANGSELARGMTPEQQQALQQKLMSNIDSSIKTQNQATDNNIEAKAAAANYVGDGAIAAVAIGSMIVTGGADAPLVIGLAIAGAGIKVGTNAALEGNDYDWSVKNVATDAAIGSVTAATSVIGPGDVAAVFGVGKEAAEEASVAAIATIGADTLKEGGEDALKAGTKTIVRDALASGAKTLDEKAFTALAEKTIAPEIVGAERDAAVAALSKELQQQVTERMATGIVRTFTQQGLNMAGGAVGGGAGGAVQGATQWDSRDSIAQNLSKVMDQAAVGSLSGAVGGGVMSAGMEGLGSGLKIVKGALGSSASSAEITVADAAANDLAGGSTDLLKTAAGTAALETGITVTQDVATDAATKATEEATKEATKEAAKTAAEKAAHEATTDAAKKTVDAAKQAVDATNQQAPKIQTNRSGRVSKIDTPQGRTTIDYNSSGTAKGGIKQVKAANGNKYFSKDGSSWTVTSKDGTTRTVQGKMSATHDGNISFAESGGKTTTMRADGSQSEADKIGNTVTRGTDGKIVGTSSPIAGASKMEYSPSGALTKINSEDGFALQKVDNGLPGSAEQWAVKTRQNPAGTVITGKGELLADGSLSVTKASGAKEIFRPDSSKIEINESGKIDRTVNAKGEESVYSYSKDGTLQSVKLPDGSEVKKLPLLERDAEGRITSISTSNFSKPIKIEYEPTGVKGETRQTIKIKDLEYSSTDGKNWVVKDGTHADGTYSLKSEFDIKDDGTVRSTSQSGRVREFRGDGSTVDFDRGGKIEGVTTGRVTWNEQADGSWVRTDPDYSWTKNYKGEMQDTPSGVIFKPTEGEPKQLTHKDNWVVTRGNGSSEIQGNNVTIDEHGTVTVPAPDATIVHKVDGSVEYRDRDSQELLVGTDAVGNKSGINVKSNVFKDDFHRSVSEKFDQLDTSTRVQDAVASVKNDLKDVKAVGANGKDTSVLDSLTSDPTLSDRQKANIVRNLAEVREHFASYRDGAKMNADPEINWVHTQGELGRVMQSARANNLSGNEMEDAMLASMYSDSVKFGFPAPTGAKPNFFTHHLDGAVAAEEALTKQGYPKERVDSIVQAIKEHQIAPPKFMGKLYYSRIDQEIARMREVGDITEARANDLRQTLDGMSSTEPNGSKVIHDIAYVTEAKKVQSADGNWEVDYSPEQKAVLKIAGVDKWSVPVDPTTTPNFKQLSEAEQAKLVSNYKIAGTLRDGDAVDNYATLGGASKIVALRKPGGGFVDDTVWKSVESVDESYQDAYNILTPGGKKLADATLAERNAALNDSVSGIRPQMDAWLKTKGLDPAKDEIPFYNSKLKRPDAPTTDERASLATNLGPDGNRLTLAERDAITYKGLTPTEIQQFKTAQEISLHMRELLLKSSRVDGSLPGNFESSVKPDGRGPWEAAKPGKYQVPELEDRMQLQNGDWQGYTKDGHVVHSEDGKVTVRNLDNNDTREYNSDGLITRARHGNTTKNFKYDNDGNLTEIATPYGSRIHSSDGKTWLRESSDANGTLTDTPFHTGKIAIDSDGTAKYIDDTESQMTIDQLDGSRDVLLRNGRRDYLTAPLDQEKASLATAVESNFKNPVHLQNFNKLQEEFEKTSAARGITDNQRALFYKQLNRLMADDQNAAIPQEQRALLAEQLMNHAAHPETVDQGSNSTCNVTTLEVRNYARNPEKNAQILADIAHDGKFVADNGQVVDMTQLDAGLKPDREARSSMRNQEKSQGAVVKTDGGRDFASQLVEVGIVNAKWQSTSIKLLDGKDLRYWNSAYDADGNFVGGLKNYHKLQTIYDNKGNELTKLAEGETAYTKGGSPIKDLNRDNLIYGEHGTLRGLTKDSNLTRIYDEAGKPIKGKPVQGMDGYDAEGKKIFRATKPGELIYDKKSAGFGPFAKERVMYKDGDTWSPLTDATYNTTMDSPNIYTNELRDANARFTGLSDSGYVISNDMVDSPQALGALLEKMKAEHNLPAVLQVHTSNRPYSQTLGIEQAWGGGSWHVVNIHDYDPVTKEVKITNQWGSKRDFLEKGQSLDLVYKTMQNSKLSAYLEQHKWTRYMVNTAAGVTVLGGLGAAEYGALQGIDKLRTPTYVQPAQPVWATPAPQASTYASPDSGQHDQPQIPPPDSVAPGATPPDAPGQEPTNQ